MKYPTQKQISRFQEKFNYWVNASKEHCQNYPTWDVKSNLKGKSLSAYTVLSKHVRGRAYGTIKCVPLTDRHFLYGALYPIVQGIGLRKIPWSKHSLKYQKHGLSAIAAFWMLETYGKVAATKEPIEYLRAINGKWLHGLNVTHWTEDLVGGLLFIGEVAQWDNHPDWVYNEVCTSAKRSWMAKEGCAPSCYSIPRHEMAERWEAFA